NPFTSIKINEAETSSLIVDTAKKANPNLLGSNVDVAINKAQPPNVNAKRMV
ncbi:MAG: hypothetical protein ACJAX0_001206, partial [Flavobacteriales bacterium]